MSRITVVGTGYVGLTAAACFADLGNDVIGLDSDPEVVNTLREGSVPIFEPGLQEMVRRNSQAGRLRFTSDAAQAYSEPEFIFIAVGTPTGENGEADLRYVRAAAADVARHLRAGAIIVNKSTVPIGTGDAVSDIVTEALAQPLEISVVSNPEFLREGSAIHDFMNPDRVVLGSHDRKAAEKVAYLYKSLEVPILITNPYTAEMIKYASNAFLATKISFINEISQVCEKLDADVKMVAEGMGLDKRIGPDFLDAGAGFGGSCFPKDVRALVHMSESIGAHPQMLRTVMEINSAQAQHLVEKTHDLLGTLRGQTIGVLGLAFKPNTDDMREAPSLAIIQQLLKKGASVGAYDPAAMERARRLLPDVQMHADAYSTAEGADALMVITEWNEFRRLDMRRIKELMKRAVIIDGRNIYDPAEMKGLGFVYKGVGQ